MWIDTHVHFDAPEFEHTRDQDWVNAQNEGVIAQVIPAVAPFNFDTVHEMAHSHANSVYALGIHPMYVMPLDRDLALAQLRAALEAHINDPLLVAVGEIGLDGFVKNIDWDTQLYFYEAQLKLAKEFNLPVLLHVRHSQDKVIKYLRQYKVTQGIAHAFNGSFEQAQAYLKQGLKLGFGGTLTFERSLQVRRLVKELPIESFVLETDAPDIPPAWVYQDNNYSYYLPRIAQHMADIRGMTLPELSQHMMHNSFQVLPRLAGVLPPL